MPTEPQPPKVFISYSHDTPAHFDRVLKLSDALREWGIDCHIDQYELAPADWVRWMESRIRKADFVLVVCTATYRRRFDGEEEPGKGLGVRHEGGVISAELYNRQTETAKFIPVLFSIADSAHIPTPLQNTQRHQLDLEKLESDPGFENLYRHLTSQPRVVARPLGKMRLFEPINKLRSLPSEDRQQEFAPIQEEPNSDKAIRLCPECGTSNNVLDPYCGECGAWLERTIILTSSQPSIQVIPPRIVQPPPPPVRHENFIERIGKGVELEMIAIPGGQFQMGSNECAEEKPIHRVTLSPFHIGKYQITQAQWQAVMGDNPSEFKGDKLPVGQVSWTMAAEFCEKLSKQTGKKYRLPIEAEWEYACRAGSTTRYYFGDDDAWLEAYAWYWKNPGIKQHPVGEKNPNAWGLYDMHGNVWEWCQDWYDENYYKQSPEEDPQGPTSGEYRVMRGGSWGSIAGHRSAYRGSNLPAFISPGIGCRVVCVARTS